MAKPVPRIRKHKARARAAKSAKRSATNEVASTSTSADTNAPIIIPTSATDKEQKRARLREELRATRPESANNARKRQRLDRYIDTKLRQDENLDLIRKIEQQGQSLNLGLLQSSRNLGAQRHGRKQIRQKAIDEDTDGGDVEEEVLSSAPVRISNRVPRELKGLQAEEDQNAGAYIRESPVQNAKSSAPTFGAGLKRSLELDEAGNPVIKRRRRSRPASRVVGTFRSSPVKSEDEWEGIRSDQSVEASGKNVLSDSSESRSSNPESDEDESDRGSTSLSASSQGSSDENSGEEAFDDADRAKTLRKQERASAFKAWATQSRNESIGFQPSTQSALGFQRSNITVPEKSSMRPEDQHDAKKPGASTKLENTNPFVGPNLQVESAEPVFNVPVERPHDIQEARLALPVVAEEQKIMEAIKEHDCTVIWGQTGSGKTTQVPQFLYEAGYGNPKSINSGMIGITQPRRVAAVSMAKRVARELGDTSGKVSYQIRFDSTVSKDTAVKFMTDGVLLRECTHDFTLSKYSAIIIDEAHERSVNTDILIGILSRVVETRRKLSAKYSKYKPLKLIIMSATLRVTDFTSNKSLFRQGLPQVIEAEGRQYPVTVHFARRTHRDYVEETFLKVSRGHKKLPPGGMLVFLTGQNEINHLAQRLRQALSSTQTHEVQQPKTRYSAATAVVEDGDLDIAQNPDQHLDFDSDSSSGLRGLDNDEDDEDGEFDVEEGTSENLKVHVLPLYSQLATEQQMRVFEPPPKDSRMIVIATNVAETSLTIPGIRYVFDCGRAKEKRFDPSNGIQTFEIGWISKASASQRTGRAGRTGPGHCYRLYSSAVFESDFPEFQEPEIRRSQLEGVVLQLKSLGIPHVSKFPFPTAPDTSSLLEAEKLLEHLGAISEGAVSPLGDELASYPLSPRLSRMLVEGLSQNCLDNALTIVSVLAVQDVLLAENQLNLSPKNEVQPQESNAAGNGDYIESLEQEQRRKDYRRFHSNLTRLDGTSDAAKLLTTVYDFSVSNEYKQSFHSFANMRSLNESIRLRRQLATIVETNHPGKLDAKASPTLPSKSQIGSLRRVVAAGYIDQIAIRADLSPAPPTGLRRPKRAIDVPYLTLFPSRIYGEHERHTEEREQDKYVFIHPSSVLARITRLDQLPQFLVYSRLSRAAGSTVTSSQETSSNQSLIKTRMHPLTPILANELVEIASGTPLLQQSKPIGKIEQVNRSDYKDGKERRMCWTTPFLVGQSGAMGWPLPPARKVVQVRDGSRKGWVVEKVLEDRSK